MWKHSAHIQRSSSSISCRLEMFDSLLRVIWRTTTMKRVCCLHCSSSSAKDCLWGMLHSVTPLCNHKCSWFPVKFFQLNLHSYRNNLSLNFFIVSQWSLERRQCVSEMILVLQIKSDSSWNNTHHHFLPPLSSETREETIFKEQINAFLLLNKRAEAFLFPLKIFSEKRSNVI